MKGVTYQYRSDGGIDWRRMIDPEFLGIKKECETEVLARFGAQNLAEIDRTKLSDNELIVLLGGWKRLLFLRGYLSLTNPCTFVTPEKAVATCTITFAPNYETRMQPVTYSWSASASYANTSGDISQMFLEPIACNRAFSLCMRGFLNINIVGKDEMGPSRRDRPARAENPAAAMGSDEVKPTASTIVTGFQGKDTLMKRCGELGLTFDKLKEGAVGKYAGELTTDPNVWVSFEDIPALDSYTLLGKIVKATRVAEVAKGKSKTKT